MPDIHHQIGVKTNTEKAYAALTTLSGLSSWWTATSCTDNTEQSKDVQCKAGEKLLFHFGDVSIEMTIVSLTENRKVVWQCSEKSGEWKDTELIFELVNDDQQTFINFVHTGWVEQTTFCAHCNTKWAVFLLSLKDYLETGSGEPFPNDRQVNCTGNGEG